MYLMLCWESDPEYCKILNLWNDGPWIHNLFSDALGLFSCIVTTLLSLRMLILTRLAIYATAAQWHYKWICLSQTKRWLKPLTVNERVNNHFASLNHSICR